MNEERGLYAAWVTSLSVPTRKLGVDIIQWLEGEDAVEAYQEEYPDDPFGPPNDYYIVNESRAERSFDVADDVEVRVLGEGATLVAAEFDDLPAVMASRPATDDGFLTYNPYWIAVNNGEVTAICEQFIP